MFVIFAGLPGTGKTSLARELARELDGVYLRVDSIEQAIRDSGVARCSLDDAGYRVAYAVAGDNLRLGRIVVGDSVNPWKLTRDAWRDVGLRAGVRTVEIEIICSDADEHRRRVETRASDVPGLAPPNWAAVIKRDYQPWDRDHVVIDTAGKEYRAKLVGDPHGDPSDLGRHPFAICLLLLLSGTGKSTLQSQKHRIGIAVNEASRCRAGGCWHGEEGMDATQRILAELSARDLAAAAIRALSCLSVMAMPITASATPTPAKVQPTAGPGSPRPPCA